MLFRRSMGDQWRDMAVHRAVSYRTVGRQKVQMLQYLLAAARAESQASTG